MKLQNRQNPEIIADLNKDWSLYDGGVYINLKCHNGLYYEYKTLDELHREWKDYTTLLPEAIRESFKQWAEFNNIEKVTYNAMNPKHSWFSMDNLESFSYDLNTILDYLEQGKEYTVKELVGE